MKAFVSMETPPDRQRFPLKRMVRSRNGDLCWKVTITRAHHPFQGKSLAVMGRFHRNKRLHLLLILPDGSRSYIPADWTDFLDVSQDGGADQTRSVALAPLSDLLHARSIIDGLLRHLPASCDKSTQPIRKGKKRAATKSGHSERTTARQQGVEQPEGRTTRRADRRLDKTDCQDSDRNTKSGEQ